MTAPSNAKNCLICVTLDFGENMMIEKNKSNAHAIWYYSLLCSAINIPGEPKSVYIPPFFFLPQTKLPCHFSGASKRMRTNILECASIMQAEEKTKNKTKGKEF